MNIGLRGCNRRTSLRSDERGIALISVIGMAGIMVILATTISVRSVNSLRQVGGERRFEQALHVADSAVDRTLSRLSRPRSVSNPSGVGPGYNTGAAVYTGTPYTREERDWVLSRPASERSPLVTVSEGQWEVVKPLAQPVVYAVGYVPSKANALETRVIRATYDFPPFVPGGAVLTDGDLSIAGGTVQVAGRSGSVHANQDVEASGNAAVNATGSVSAVGSVPPNVQDCEPAGTVDQCAENKGAGRPRREVPPINPRDSYNWSEFDLCPDGSVRAGPAYPITPDETAAGTAVNTTGVPCGGGNSTILSPAGAFRGWRLSGTTWAYNEGNTNVGFPGVYYAYRGDVDIKGSPGSDVPWEVTILAESVDTTHSPCSHEYGDIKIGGSPVMRPHPKGNTFLFMAGRDLVVTGNPGTNLEGTLAAHEQFEVTGSADIAGVLISEDVCNTSGSPVPNGSNTGSTLGGNIRITFNGDFEVPIAGAIRTTHWQEL